MELIMPAQTDKAPAVMQALRRFRGALLELTSPLYPDYRFYGRVAEVIIRNHKGDRLDLQLAFEWSAEPSENGEWIIIERDRLNFDAFLSLFFIAVDDLLDPQRLFLYLPRGEQCYLLDRNKQPPQWLARFETVIRRRIKRVRHKAL